MIKAASIICKNIEKVDLIPQDLLTNGVIHSNFIKRYHQPLYETIKKHNCLDEIRLYDCRQHRTTSRKRYHQPLYETIKKHNCLDEIRLYDCRQHRVKLTFEEENFISSHIKHGYCSIPGGRPESKRLYSGLGSFLVQMERVWTSPLFAQRSSAINEYSYSHLVAKLICELVTYGLDNIDIEYSGLSKSTKNRNGGKSGPLRYPDVTGSKKYPGSQHKWEFMFSEISNGPYSFDEKHYLGDENRLAQHGTKMNIKKAPSRLIKFFKLQHEAIMCHHCLYKTDDDPEYVNLPNYPQPPERISKENIRKFQDRSYVLRNDIIYSQFEFQELEFAYHEVCAELDETKLGKSILNPEEFKKMLEKADPSLKAGLNNKFINGVKAEVGLLLDASGASSSAIETLAGAGLTIRRETIARQKTQHAEAHTMTVGEFLLKNIKSLVVLNVDDFHNIHEHCHSDTISIHEVSHFIMILLKVLSKTTSIPFCQEKSVHNEKNIDSKIIISNAYSSSFFPYSWLSYIERKQAFTNLMSLYDDKIEQRRTDRSMENMKLIDLKEGSLHSTTNYIDALRYFIDVSE
ncbi:779_t:CDS:2, partial [Ambispora gerdemannii]